MSNPFFITYANPKYVDYPNSIRLTCENQDNLISFNYTDQNYFLKVKLDEYNFVTTSLENPDFLKCIGFDEQALKGKITLETLYNSFNISLEIGNNCVILFFYWPEYGKNAFYALKLDWYSYDCQIDRTLNISNKIHNLQNHINCLLPSFHLGKNTLEPASLTLDYENLNKKLMSHEDQLTNIALKMKSTQDALESKFMMAIEDYKISNDAKLAEFQQKIDQLNVKCEELELNISKLKEADKCLYDKIAEFDINLPTYGQLDNLENRLSLIESKLTNIKPVDLKVTEKLEQKIKSFNSMINERKVITRNEIPDLSPFEKNLLYEELKSNNTLKILDLYGNNIGAAGAEAISIALNSNNTLTDLNLYGNNIGVKGAEAFANALINNSTLTTLILEYNNIGVEGAKSIGKALKSNCTLTTLNLKRNKIGAAGEKFITDAIKSNTNSKVRVIFD